MQPVLRNRCHVTFFCEWKKCSARNQNYLFSMIHLTVQSSIIKENLVHHHGLQIDSDILAFSIRVFY